VTADSLEKSEQLAGYMVRGLNACDVEKERRGGVGVLSVSCALSIPPLRGVGPATRLAGGARRLGRNPIHEYHPKWSVPMIEMQVSQNL